MGTRDDIGSLRVRVCKFSDKFLKRLVKSSVDDTPFRLFRESNPALKSITWISVAGNIEEIKNVAAELEQHGNKYSTEMAKKIYQAIPRFEDGEHVISLNSQSHAYPC